MLYVFIFDYLSANHEGSPADDVRLILTNHEFSPADDVRLILTNHEFSPADSSPDLADEL